MWKFLHYHLVLTGEPKTIPAGVTRVLNLRGTAHPAYDVPPGVHYKALFLPGGPSAYVPFWRISNAVKYVMNTKPGGICLVHCQHGLNRTGLVACAVATQEIGLTAEEAMVIFAQLRSPGIQREQVRITLRKWAGSVRDHPFQKKS